MKRLNADNPVLPLSVRQIEGGVTYTAEQAVAWFRMAPQTWQWRSDGYREQVINNATRVYATLATIDGLPDRTIHIRVTQRPYPAHEWASAVTRITPSPVDPDAWKARLVATQRRMRSSTLSDTECYVGVPVADRKAIDRLTASAKRGRSGTRERAKIAALVADLADVMALPGFGARLIDQAELEWLMHRSVGLGLPEPVNVSNGSTPMDAADVATFYDSVDVDPRPRKRSIRVTGHPVRDKDLNEVSRYVAVCSLGRMEALSIPEHLEPWIAVSEVLPFPVEWSLRIKLRTGKDASTDMEKRLQMVEDQVEQHQKHHIAIRPALRRTFARATAVGDEMEEGHRTEAARYQAWFRVAVWAKTEEDLARRVRALRNLYEGMHIDVEWEGGQHGLYREFIPGEALSSNSHTRRGPVNYLAGAVPNLASRIGDRRGDYLGFTSAISKRACIWDPHFGIEVRESSGLTPVIGGLGAGKSVVIGSVGYSTALRGISTTILDPSGPLSRLCYMPELKEHSRHVDLLQSPAGTLSPYTVIPDPSRANLLEDDRLSGLVGAEREAKADELYADAKDAAGRTRQQLATDVLRLLLPPAFRTGDAGRLVRVLVGDAVREVGGRYTSGLGAVLDRIRDDPRDHDHEIYNLLHDMSQYPQSRLFFGPGYMTDYSEVKGDPTLLVLTMAGLQLPDENVPEDNWSEQERIAVPLLTLAAHYTSKRIYSKPMSERKLVGLDEAHFLRGIPTGRSLVDRLARDSRKWTTRVMLATQKCADLEALSAHGLVREMFGGRIEDVDEARAFLKLIGVPLGAGYEAQLANLSGGETTREDADSGYREFVMRDVYGNVEVIRMDIKEHQPHLYETLRTRRRDDVTRPSEAAPIALTDNDVELSWSGT
jgi:hypothetical protein